MAPKKTASGPSVKELEQEIEAMTTQVRELKLAKAGADDIDLAYAKLKALKHQLRQKVATKAPSGLSTELDCSKLQELLQRRFFYDQSCSLYGGVPGLVDYGPMGAALQRNLIEHWRTFFVHEDNMLELSCATLTPEKLLRAAGHVEHLKKPTVRCKKTGELLRADTLLMDHIHTRLKDIRNPPLMEEEQELQDTLHKLPKLTIDEIYPLLKKWKVRSPGLKTGIHQPALTSELVQSQTGPQGAAGFLRPDGAHGAVTNFKRLIEFNHKRLPCAVAQIGTAFRNEVLSPVRGIFLDTREFTLLEIEHFGDPTKMSHRRLKGHRGHNLMLFTRQHQEKGQDAKRDMMREFLEDAVIRNEALAYYMARSSTYLKKIGVDPVRVRFRQLVDGEKPHYAQDAWDVEVLLTSHGWVSVASLVDRGTYDADVHTQASGVPVRAEVKLDGSTNVSIVELLPVNEKIQKQFPKLYKSILAELKEYTGKKALAAEKSLAEENKLKLKIAGEKVSLTRDMVTVRRRSEEQDRKEIVPAVVQITFVLPRIMYAVLDHAFRVHSERMVLELRPYIAPYQCVILPQNSKALHAAAEQLHRELHYKEIRSRVDVSSSSMSARKKMVDETGTPYCIILDDESKPKAKEVRTAMLRQCASDSTIVISLKELKEGILVDLLRENKDWSDVTFSAAPIVPEDPEPNGEDAAQSDED